MNPESQNNQKSNAALREEAVLAFWKENEIFKKSLLKDAPNGEFVFFEGPPTANAKPALHHLEARAFKDVVPRYKTMQGFHVRRRAGWDTHGLPVELQIEKKLGFTHKKQIEDYGIAAFNKECKDSVFEFIKDWEVFTDRIGYWVDKEHAYYTFDSNYMESLWNILATVEKQNLLYKDYKVVPWCARCGTALASHELAQGYQDDKDLSVIAKFKIKGQENTYLLAWTTTPWTLPGNVGLAVGKDIEYILIKIGGENFILAKERLEIISQAYETISELKGSDLIGLEYEPLYPYLGEFIKGHHQEKNMTNAYKVYAADFVTTTDGTGIVHIAPMYGADDFDVATKNSLPKFHTVTDEGKFVTGTDFLEGRFVKDEDVAVDIIKDLAHRGLLFKKEKYEHSYPHCWRCKTPLIYFARDSWYIRMESLREKLVSENEEINWEPDHIKEGRFGEWLRNIKDWAISRERYWGTPLPIWQPKDHLDTERIVVDSIDTLKKYSKKSGNQYFVMRHGQTEHNLKRLWSFADQNEDKLTEAGKKQIADNAMLLKEKNIDIIFASPFLRTLETARLAAKELGMDEQAIVTDVRLSEWNAGKEFDNMPLDDFFKVRNASPDRYQFKTSDGESYVEVFARASEFLYDIEKQYAGKNILIVTHGALTRAIELASWGIDFKTMYARTREYTNFDNAEVRHIDFAPLPHNDLFELDLHRPYIDSIVLEKDGKEFHRVREVMDVWFDSGSMPFAQDHYPFQNKEYIDTIGYPADFISEAIDQTRGWFYTLHAVGNLLRKGKAYKNVICLGHLLDKDGKKMSKSIGNIVEPFSQIDKFGADTVRLWMYSVNAPGESKNYDEKTVGELQRQVFGLLYNVLAFYELYRDEKVEDGRLKLEENENVLDQWIITRLDQLITTTTDDLDHYRLMNPVREIRAFIEDLSTWYVRRSRDRIKDGDGNAKITLYRVLKTLAQVLAPFAPFAAEDIWLKLRHDEDAESVHLSEWPKAIGVSEELLNNMKVVRDICTQGNALRKKEGIAVKQPLNKLEVAGFILQDQYKELIKDELNVKDVIAGIETKLDTTITPELKAEGSYRELVRAIQDLRKENGLTPQDMITLTISANAESFLTPFLTDFKKTVLASAVNFTGNDGTKITIDEMTLKITIEK
jgi:isoleucyl-tRNA synthetase